MLGDLLGRRAALGEDDVELLPQHRLGQLANALFRHDAPPLGCGRSVARPLCAASMAGRAPAIKDLYRWAARSPNSPSAIQADSFIRWFHSSLSLSRRTLPRSLLGRSETITTCLGTFGAGRCARQCSITAASVRPADGRGTTKHTTSSP